jgi:hypothetical protein
VAFESRQLHGAELHYPVHEQEMLSIIHALKKWHCDLLSSNFTIYTDHQTLWNFNMQKELSKRQARWMEYMSQYDCTINYINGDNNCITDMLLHLPNSVDRHTSIVANVFKIRSDPVFIQDIKDRYRADPWCKALATDLARGMTGSKLGLTLRNRLIFIGQRPVIPKHKDLQESLFQLAHNNMGHFGNNKSYDTLRRDLYWPNM